MNEELGCGQVYGISWMVLVGLLIIFKVKFTCAVAE